MVRAHPEQASETLPRFVQSIEAGEKLSDEERQALLRLATEHNTMQTAESLRRVCLSVTQELHHLRPTR